MACVGILNSLDLHQLVHTVITGEWVFFPHFVVVVVEFSAVWSCMMCDGCYSLTVELNAEIGKIAQFCFLGTTADEILHVKIPVFPVDGDPTVLLC